MLNKYQFSSNPLPYGDAVTVNEFVLTVINDGQLNDHHFKNLQVELYKKYLNGTYDEFDTHRIFFNLIPILSKFYAETQCSDGDCIPLDLNMRHHIADELLSHYTEDFEYHPNGGYLGVGEIEKTKNIDSGFGDNINFEYVSDNGQLCFLAG